MNSNLPVLHDRAENRARMGVSANIYCDLLYLEL